MNSNLDRSSNLLTSSLIILTLLFLQGCAGSEFITRSEFAYGTPFAIGKAMNDHHKGKGSGGLSFQGVYVSVKPGLRYSLYDDIELDAVIGTGTFIREGGQGQYFGLEANPRINYSAYFIKPYIEAIVGVGYLPEKWYGEATNWQFSIGGGAGITVPINDELQISLGYRLYHISNGSSIFGSPRPNLGYNTDLFVIGLNYQFH